MTEKRKTKQPCICPICKERKAFKWVQVELNMSMLACEECFHAVWAEEY